MLGAMHAASFESDPKHLGFVLARYKFVAKMLGGPGHVHVLEVGCGDTTGARVVKAAVSYLEGVDTDDAYVNNKDSCIRVHKHDMTIEPFVISGWDAIYALDVLEHVPVEKERRFLNNIARSVAPRGTVIIGTPSLESQAYASAESRKHHVNCKTEDSLRELLSAHFSNVFLFGMNDETLHTGFGPMCHYRLAICTGPYRFSLGVAWQGKARQG
jgi:SAM-dependent methyltransferase